LAILTIAGTVQAQVNTNILYQNIFNRALTLNGSTPSPVNTSNATWIAWQQLFTDVLPLTEPMNAAKILFDQTACGGINGAAGKLHC
jgi:hypothetical protein